MENFTMEQSGMDIVRKAQVYAMAAHAAVGQKRKYTNEPYIVHPAEVAKIVAGVPGATPDMVAAAWLHDVVEDTGCTFTDIHMAFGIDIATLVGWLTDVSKPEDGNRAHRQGNSTVLTLLRLLQKHRQSSWLISVQILRASWNMILLSPRLTWKKRDCCWL